MTNRSGPSGPERFARSSAVLVGPIGERERHRTMNPVLLAVVLCASAWTVALIVLTAAGRSADGKYLIGAARRW